jgi:thiol-disulfide isomerase/thioredoxin
VLNLKENTLPFNLTISDTDSTWIITNADEKIEISEVQQEGDSIIVDLPVFESRLLLKVISAEKMEGVWHNLYKGKNYKIPLQANWGKSYRFFGTTPPTNKKLFSKYQVTFSPETDSAYQAIGLFRQEKNRVTGTFATETGDYRFLEGNIRGDSLFLSTFDGAHAFLFNATIKDSLLEGMFYSGRHYQTSWKGVADSDFRLRNPDSLTYLKPGFEKIDFTLESSNGETIHFQDPYYQGKVRIIQIMGSWCPNCLDETNYLKQLQQDYESEGLTIFALAFERTRSQAQAMINLQKLKQSTGANYPFLLAAYSREQSPLDVLPMLNHIMSYPTTIIIDKKGEVRKIHTGFYGPGTGKLYDNFAAENKRFVEKLLAENPN